MDKKLKIYITLAMIAMIATTVMSTLTFNGNYAGAAQDGYLEITDNKPENNNSGWTSFSVPVRPKCNRQDLVSHCGGQTYSLEIQKVKISAPESEWHGGGWLKSMLTIVAIAGVAIAFWIFGRFIKIIIHLRTGAIFMDDFVKVLKITGILTLVFYAIQLASATVVYYCLFDKIELAGYELAFPELENSQLFVGFGFLIISRIVDMGRTMKEEQDLTI